MTSLTHTVHTKRESKQDGAPPPPPPHHACAYLFPRILDLRELLAEGLDLRDEVRIPLPQFEGILHHRFQLLRYLQDSGGARISSESDHCYIYV